MTITHDAVDLTVQGPALCKGPLCTRPRLETCSLEDPTPTSADIWWLAIEARMVGEWVVCILLECFLVTFVMCVWLENNGNVHY